MHFLGRSRKMLILRDFFADFMNRPGSDCRLGITFIRLRTVHRHAVNRFFRPMGRALTSVALVAALIAALLAPAAQAGGSQKTLSKKQSQSATGSKGSKGNRGSTKAKATATRKAAAHAGVARASAKTARMPARGVAFVPARPSFGQIAGLHEVSDPLALRSSVALVVDQDTNEVLLSKNDHAVLPIASLTKLMTGLLISQAKLPMDELLTITQDDVDMEKGSRSRLTVGTTLTRGAMLHLALMASENRAAHALGRTYPGGLAAFVAQMNAQARRLGMTDTHYAEPTGLSS